MEKPLEPPARVFSPSRVALPEYDPTAPVSVSIEEINKMDAATYNKKLQNPRFRESVDQLMAKIGQSY